MLRRIFVKAGLVAALSAVVSVAISSIIAPGPYLLVDGLAWIMSIACPLAIAFPASAYTFWQKEKIRAALESAEDAHAQLKAAHRLLSERVRRDTMTGLLNREAFIEEVELARHARGGVLLFADADHFKRINDSHGHLAGDAALTRIASAIAGAVREDDIVGRIGGEEFGVFLLAADRREAALLAERIRARVEGSEFEVREGLRLRLTISIGAGSHVDDTPLRDLMRDADNRLYEAKRSGRNRVVMEPLALAA